jgi:hypothetical protein
VRVVRYRDCLGDRQRRNRSRKEREIAPDRFCQILEGLRCARRLRVAISQRFAKT